MSTHLATSFFPEELKSGDKKLKRNCILLLEQEYALGHYGVATFLVVALNGDAKVFKSENNNPLKQVQIAFPNIVSLHQKGSAEQIQCWNVHTSHLATLDLWNGKKSQLIMASERGIVVVVSDSIYRLKYGFNSKSRPQLITNEKYVSSPSANLSAFDELHALVSNSSKLLVCNIKTSEIVLRYDLHSKDRKASFLVSKLSGNTVVMGTVNSLYIFTIGDNTPHIIPQLSTPSAFLIHFGHLFVGDFNGEIAYYDLDRRTKLFNVTSMPKKEGTLLDNIDSKIDNMIVQDNYLVALSHSGKLDMWHADCRGQTLPLLSLANESGGILTAFKATPTLLYAFFEANDNNDKLLIWKSSFEQILNSAHAKTSSTKEVIFSGSLLLMTDPAKKPVKRYFQLSENVLWEFKSSKETNSPLGSFLLHGTSSVSKLEKKKDNKTFLCLSLSKDDQIYLSAPTQEIEKQWVQALNSAIEATSIRFYWRINYEDLLFDKEPSGMRVTLGQGQNSVVYRGVYHGQPVAIKEFSSAMSKKFETEVTMLSAMKHENIVDLIGACIPLPNSPHSRFALIQPYLPLGSLRDQLHGPSTKPFTWAIALKIFYEIAAALNYIHTFQLDGRFTPIIHRDLKPANMLVASLDPYANTPIIMLSDLGMSRYDAMVQTSQVGTITYMAPEVMTGSVYSTAADIFSYAVCIWEIVTRTVPYDRESVIKVHQMLQSKQRLPIPPHIPPAIAEVINACWRHVPEERPSASIIMERVNEIQASFICDDLMDKLVTEKTTIPIGVKSQKLYGQSDTISKAMKGVKRWKQGTCEILLFTGPSGIGKTSVIKTLCKFCSVKNFIGQGSWPTRGAREPFRGIIQALSSCLLHIIDNWATKEIERFKTDLLFAFDDDGLAILSYVLPNFGALIQHETRQVEGSDFTNSTHLQWVFAELIRLMATRDHPLIIFLDDLHYGDLSSMLVLLEIKNFKNLLLICSYDDSQISKQHPFQQTLSRFQQKIGYELGEIPILPLDSQSIQELVHQYQGELPSQELVNFILSKTQLQGANLTLLGKTGGAPFAVWQFIECKKKHAIGGWLLDVPSPSVQNTLSDLQPDDHMLIHLLACLNSPFDVETISAVKGRITLTKKTDSYLIGPKQSKAVDPASTTKSLGIFVDLGILEKVEKGYWFIHSGTWDELYNFIQLESKAAIHFQIAQLFSEILQKNQTVLGVTLAETAEHYRLGTNPQCSQEERLASAKVIVKVGVEFVQILKAYDVGYAYCLAAAEILGLSNQTPNQEKSLWDMNHQLCWDLYYSLLQCEKSRGDTKAAGRLIQALGRKTKTTPQTNQREETLVLTLDYLHFQGVRNEISSAKEIFAKPELVQVIKDKLVVECDGDIANAVIPRATIQTQTPEIEDLHAVLLVGLEAALALKSKHVSQWMLYEIVGLYFHNPGLRRHLKPSLMIAMELEQQQFRAQALKILKWCKPFVTSLGDLSELQHVPTLEMVTNAYWNEFPARYMIDKLVNLAINIAIERNYFNHVGFHFINRFILHFAMGNWTPDNILTTFRLSLAQKLAASSAAHTLLFDIYTNGCQYVQTNNPTFLSKAQELVKELASTDVAKVWSHLFVHYFADVVYDNGISMTIFLHSKEVTTETSGLYIQPLIWWCSSVQLFRYACRVPFSDPHRAAFIDKARLGLENLIHYERGGRNLEAHIHLLNALNQRIIFAESGRFNKNKDKQVVDAIYYFNKALLVAREIDHAWVYAITCECAAEFYQEQNMRTMAKAYLEEALLTYQSLNVVAKVEQLQRLLDVTALPGPSNTGIPKSLLTSFSNFSRGLLESHNQIMTLPEDKREPYFQAFQGHLKGINSFLQVLNSKDATGKFPELDPAAYPTSLVQLPQVVEDVSSFVSLSFTEPSPVIPIIQHELPQLILANFEKVHALILSLVMAFRESYEGTDHFFLFVYRDEEASSQLPRHTFACCFHLTDTYPEVFPWDTDEKDGESSSLPTPLKFALENVMPQLNSFNGNTHFEFSKGATKFKFRAFFGVPQKSIGIAMVPSGFIAKVIMQYLKDTKYDFVIPSQTPEGLQFRPTLPSLILVDEGTDVSHLKGLNTRIILISKGLANVKGDYDEVISISNLSKLHNILKLTQ